MFVCVGGGGPIPPPTPPLRKPAPWEGWADQTAQETFDNCSGSDLKATFGTNLKSNDCIPVSWGYTEAKFHSPCGSTALAGAPLPGETVVVPLVVSLHGSGGRGG